MARNIDEDVNVNGNVRVDGQTTVTGNVAMHNDLLVSGNTTIGGKTTMRGAVTMDGAVKIKGWLDVENLNFPSVGIFPTEEALSAAETPVKGRIAGVMVMDESVSSNSSSSSTNSGSSSGDEPGSGETPVGNEENNDEDEPVEIGGGRSTATTTSDNEGTTNTGSVSTLIPDIELYYGNGEQWVDSGRTIPIHIYLNMTSEIVDPEALDEWQQGIETELNKKAPLSGLSITPTGVENYKKLITLKQGDEGSGKFLTPYALAQLWRFTDQNNRYADGKLPVIALKIRENLSEQSYTNCPHLVPSTVSLDDVVTKVTETGTEDQIVILTSSGKIKNSEKYLYNFVEMPNGGLNVGNGKLAVWDTVGKRWQRHTYSPSDYIRKTELASQDSFVEVAIKAELPSAFFAGFVEDVSVVVDTDPVEVTRLTKDSIFFDTTNKLFLYLDSNGDYHANFTYNNVYNTEATPVRPRQNRIFIKAAGSDGNIGTPWYYNGTTLVPITTANMSITAGTGADADKTTIQLKEGLSATVLTEHQDISGKANKSEMEVSTSSGTTTITLKTGTSAQLYSKAKVDEMIADAVADATGRAVGEAVRCTYNITTAGTYTLYNMTGNNDGDLKLIVIDGVGYRDARNIQLSTGTVEVLYVFKDATKIPEEAFFKFNGGSAHVPNLTALHLPSFIHEIGANAFNGCSNLRAIDCEAMTPPTIRSSAFSDAGISGGTLTVHNVVLSEYDDGSNKWAGAGTVANYQ